MKASPKLSLKFFVLLILILMIYIFAGKLSLQLAFFNASATAIWPPTGIAIAVLLLLGYRVWPIIFLGAFIVNITTQGSVGTSMGIALGNTLEAILGAYLMTRFANGKHAFDSVANVFKFAFLAGVVSTAVSATIGVGTLLLGGYTNLQDAHTVWITWWLGDMGGAIGVAPLIILWSTFEDFTINQIADTALFFLSIFIVSELVFSGFFPYPYLCIPVLLWGAFRLGQREEMGALFILAAISIWNTLHGFGPYIGAKIPLNESLLLLQLFLGTTAVTTMTLTAALIERKQSRSALQGSERRFQALIEKSFDAIVLIDATSKILYASSSVKRLLGYTQEELVGITGFDLVIPEDRSHVVRELARLVLKPGGALTVQYRTRKKDKTIIWVEATGTNLLFEPSVHAVVVNFHDITERKMSQEKILQEKAEDEALLASIGEGIIATDSVGRITIVNQAACDMLRYTSTHLIGKMLIDVIPMQDSEGRTLSVSERPMSKVISLKKKVITSPHNYYVRSDKTVFPIRFTLTPIFLDKVLIGSVEVFRDITKETEIDRAKSEFVSLASHQLRTPLTTINWYIERLTAQEVGKIPPKQKKYLDEIYHASRRMVMLINSLLNASRLELGTFIVEPQKISIPEVVKEVMEEIFYQKPPRGVRITRKIDTHIPLMSLDKKLFTIIIQNLLSNAVKYSKDDGVVSLLISFDKKVYTIIVEDLGIGIPKKDQKNIFTKMFRADNAKVLDRDGTGLGLYIVKSIVDSTGGKVWFESKNGKTTFYVTYPASGMTKKEGSKQLR